MTRQRESACEREVISQTVAKVLPFPRAVCAPEPVCAPGLSVGRLARLQGDGHAWVQVGPAQARYSLKCVVMGPLDALDLDTDVAVWEPRDGLGLVLGRAASTPQAEALRAPVAEGELGPVEALVDGRRVVVEAEQEIVLRCGAASITLRANGRVLIQGTQVETCAAGVNRIKGGSVQIN